MKRGWQVAGACLFLLFAFALWKASALPLEDSLGPGPGFFPFWLSLLGMGLAALLVLELSRSREAVPAGTVETPDRGAVGRILAVLAGIAAAAALLEPLGFRIVALAFCALLLPVVGARSPLVIIAFALLGSFGVFHVFYHWLKVPLPIGILGV